MGPDVYGLLYSSLEPLGFAIQDLDIVHGYPMSWAVLVNVLRHFRRGRARPAMFGEPGFEGSLSLAYVFTVTVNTFVAGALDVIYRAYDVLLLRRVLGGAQQLT